MALLNNLVGGTGTAQNLTTKWKEKRAQREFKKKYAGLKGEPSEGYLAGYSSIGDDSATYQGQLDRVSYALTDSYPNIDQGFTVRTIARTFWDDQQNMNLQNTFLGINDKIFRYGFGYDILDDHDYEDPTYLGFEITIDTENSPLFDFNKNFVPSPGTSTTPATSPTNGTASYFFKQYENMDINDTKDRMRLLKEFQYLFLQIMPNTFNNNYKTNSRTYYIQNIRGLELLPKKMIEYKKDKLTFVLNEDIALRATYLAELYNNIAYSYKYQRLAIPENCLRFDMVIKISDKRMFNIPKSQTDLDEIKTVNNPNDLFDVAENSYIIYTLHDCILDFQMSQPHGQQLQMGGYVAADYTTSSLEFNVFYKSVSKTFESKLLGPISDSKGTFILENKSENLIFDVDSSVLRPDAQFPSTVRQTANETKIRKSDPLAGTGFADRLKGELFGGDTNVDGGVFQQVGDRLFSAAVNTVDNMFDAAMQEGRKIRGELIDKLTKKITGGDFVVEIFPANVYDINLDGIAGDGLSDITLRQQLSNFQLDLFSQGRNILGNALNDLTSF